MMMINRFANLTSRLAALFAIIFALAACGGGGGGGGGGSFLPDNDGDQDTTEYLLTLDLTGPDGEPTNTVTTTRPGTLTITVTTRGSNKKPIADEIVSASAALASVNPESGTALTNAEGVATFEITTGGAAGADSISVSVDAPAGTITETLNYQVGQAGLRLGSFSGSTFQEGVIDVQPETTLSPTGSGTLTLAIVDEEGNRVETEEKVTITSECLLSGDATLDPASPIAFVAQATVTYTAAGCEGDDSITATLTGNGNTASGTISIAPLTANAISFEGADPELIVLKGTGGGTARQESSTVVFKVVDSDNNVVPGIDVNFALSTEIGGLTLGNDSDVSDASGLVSTTVFSGNVATVVRVFARLVDAGVSTTSDVLVVSTGLPDQNSISLSVQGGFVIENGFSIDGIERCVSVRMADKFNNPVPEGTSAVFTTEYGAIDSSCILGVRNGSRASSCGAPTAGLCSVLWTSQEPRAPTINPGAVRLITGETVDGDDYGYACKTSSLGVTGHSASSGPCPTDLGGTRGGRSTISVTSVGEESFVDANGNGTYDRNEAFVNLPEAFNDHNEDGVFTPAEGAGECGETTSDGDCILAGSEETFVDFNSNFMYDTNVSPEFPNGVYNGTLCPPEGDGVFCSRDLVNVRASTVLILSGAPSWDIIVVDQGGGRETSKTGRGLIVGTSYFAYVSDIFNNSPPAGSKITVSGGGDCSVSGSFEVPSTPSRGAFGVDIVPDGEGATGSVTVTLDPTEGSSYSETWNCTPLTPPDPNEDELSTGG